MTIELSNLVRVKLAKETTFGTSGSYSGNTRDIEAHETPSPTLTVELFSNSSLRQRKEMHAQSKDIVGRKQTTLPLTTYVYGAVNALSGAQATSQDVHGDVLETVFGATVSDQGDEVTGTPAVDDIEPTTASQFDGGQAIGLMLSEGFKVRSVKRKTGSPALIPHVDFPSAPSAGEAIYNSYTYYLDQDSSGSLQAELQWRDSNHHEIFMGLNGGFELNVPLNDPPTISYSFQGADFVSGSSHTIGTASYSSRKAIAPTDYEVLLVPCDTGNAAASLTTEKVGSVSISPGITWEPRTGYGGVNNVLRMIRRQATPTATVQVYGHAAKWYEARDNRTEYYFSVQLGAVPGDTAYVWMPLCQIVDVQPIDLNGEDAVEISLKAFEDRYASDTTGGIEDLLRSAIKYARL